MEFKKPTKKDTARLLRRLRDEGPKNPTVGICTNLGNLADREGLEYYGGVKDHFKEAMIKVGYTDTTHPLSDPSGKHNNEDWYHTSTGPHWEGVKLKQRMELIRKVLRVLR